MLTGRTFSPPPSTEMVAETSSGNRQTFQHMFPSIGCTNEDESINCPWQPSKTSFKLSPRTLSNPEYQTYLTDCNAHSHQRSNTGQTPTSQPTILVLQIHNPTISRPSSHTGTTVLFITCKGQGIADTDNEQ